MVLSGDAWSQSNIDMSEVTCMPLLHLKAAQPGAQPSFGGLMAYGSLLKVYHFQVDYTTTPVTSFPWVMSFIGGCPNLTSLQNPCLFVILPVIAQSAVLGRIWRGWHIQQCDDFPQ